MSPVVVCTQQQNVCLAPRCARCPLTPPPPPPPPSPPHPSTPLSRHRPPSSITTTTSTTTTASINTNANNTHQHMHSALACIGERGGACASPCREGPPPQPIPLLCMHLPHASRSFCASLPVGKVVAFTQHHNQCHFSACICHTHRSRCAPLSFGEGGGNSHNNPLAPPLHVHVDVSPTRWTHTHACTRARARARTHARNPCHVATTNGAVCIRTDENKNAFVAHQFALGFCD
jgi:hypothetical protein